MIRSSTQIKIAGVALAIGLSLIVAPPVLAQAGGAQQVESFIRSVIQLIAGLAGLIATGFLWLVALPISRAPVILNN